MSDRDRGDDSYTGRAGQQAFIAQVLLRFGNAAVPVVDVGTDVIVFSDALDLAARVQVKTAKVIRTTSASYSAEFNIPLKQLDTNDIPPLFFALVTRDDQANCFPDILLIARSQLQEYRNGPRLFGTVESAKVKKKKQKRRLKLRVVFHPLHGVVCKGVDLTRHRDDWSALPPLVSSLIQAAERSEGGV